MQNSARLQQLGIPPLSSIMPNMRANAPDKRKRSRKNSEHSESEYEPSQNDTGERDSIDDDSDKGSKDKSCKKTKQHAPDMHLGGVKFRSRKRVYAEQPPTRATRRMTSIAQAYASLTRSNISEPSPSQANVTQADGFAHHDDNNIMAAGADAITNPGGHNMMTYEGGLVRCNRGVNMGHGLQRLTRARRGKLPVVITQGNTRPLVPLVAAKFATECNIAVRNHVPVLKHWKDYKKEPALFNLFMGRLSAKFDIDTSDEIVKHGCMEMMKIAVRQQRYKLKREHFDPFPLHLVRKTSPIKSMTNEHWIDLETCQKNKDNQGNVKFHKTTGSSTTRFLWKICLELSSRITYTVIIHFVIQSGLEPISSLARSKCPFGSSEHAGDKYNDEEPDASDLFKECHYSKKKKGYTSTVQLAITQMENQLAAPTEGEQTKSATQVVAEVLHKNTKKSQFLHNVGIQIVLPRSSVQNAQAELEAEKRANAELQSIVNSQRAEMDDLSKKVQETEQAMNKKQADMEAKLERLLAQSSST
ncbi:hypothetical protein GQ55_6G112400 [Panicum hallii var. hallii]|uniref:Uncharacterized protein n=1 Tax=Panicum hallii var. hallii TaxID=1504633 RepID=A0A2T7D5P4_9POAL|nr:hypothetical protein GQ55_6G112400 [Panicum hallii var. hallii]